MGRYDPLRDYLTNAGPSELHLSFGQIEDILGGDLPDSARKFQAWWANDATRSRHAGAWLLAGWKTEGLNLTAETVTFRRVSDRGAAAQRQAALAERTGSRQPRRAEDLAALALASVNSRAQVSVDMHWRTLGAVTADQSGRLEFPVGPALPGLYRFRLMDEGTRHYIGETADLRRRFYHYRNPGPSQATNIRINDLLRANLAAGDRVEIDIITEGVTLTVDGESVPAVLADKPVRRLLENAALVAEGAAEIDSLNR